MGDDALQATSAGPSRSWINEAYDNMSPAEAGRVAAATFDANHRGGADPWGAVVNGFGQYSNALNTGARAGVAVAIGVTAATVGPVAVAGTIELGVEGVAVAKSAGGIWSLRVGLQLVQVSTNYATEQTIVITGTSLVGQNAAAAARAAAMAAAAARFASAPGGPPIP